MATVYKYDSAWTKRLESMNHWQYYWHQQKLMEGLVNLDSTESIVEVGVGSGFTANYCRSKGFEVVTLDIDKDKNPDIVANVVTHNFDRKFDHFLAFEILEHIPFDEAVDVIRKIPAIASRFAFISVPTNRRRFLSLHLKVPRFRAFSFDWYRKRGKITTPNHHWELEYAGYSRERLESTFTENNLKVVRRLEHDYIRFYALEILSD